MSRYSSNLELRKKMGTRVLEHQKQSKSDTELGNQIRKLTFHLRSELSIALILSDIITDSRDKVISEYGMTILRSLNGMVSAIDQFETGYRALSEESRDKQQAGEAIKTNVSGPAHARKLNAREASAGGKILLVEDNAVNQALVKRILERMGFIVIVASSGEHALKISTESQFDLVLMDITLPGIDGYKTCQEIKAIPGLTDVPIVGLSAHSDSAARRQALQVGMREFLIKPVDSKVLSETINKLLFD